MSSRAHVVILGCNFAGLTTARYIADHLDDRAELTVVDRKPYLTFIPNIPLEVWSNENPAADLHRPFVSFLDRDGTRFVQGDVREIDVEARRVEYVPTERDTAPVESLSYDYLGVALGNRLALDDIDGFAEHGHTFTDTYYGDRIRRHLHGGGYRGGPVAIGSDFFAQGQSPSLPEGLPVAEAACEGPVVEIAFSLAHWLEERGLGDASSITLFTPAEVLAEDAGEKILDQLLPMMDAQGFHLRVGTEGIGGLHEDGIEFEDGSSLEAELKIVFPNWTGHDLLRGLPVTDDQGFVVTDLHMRNPDYPEIFAVGDAASITVPKIGSLGHAEAEVCARTLATVVRGDEPKETVDPVHFEIVCMGDMGGHRGFYMHTDEWWGGDTSELRVGYRHHLLKQGFKQMYFATGGKIPHWGLPLAEAVAEQASRS